jgi:hypothetical protein
MKSVLPALIFKATVAFVLLIVRVDPAPVNLTVLDPVIVIELIEMVGTLLIVQAPVALIAMSSPASGIVPPDQLAPTTHDPLPARVHVFNAENDMLSVNANRLITSRTFARNFEKTLLVNFPHSEHFNLIAFW